MATYVYSTPKTFLEMLLEFSNTLEKYRKDNSVSKEDVAEMAEENISMIIGKLVAVPTTTSFSLFRSNDD